MSVPILYMLYRGKVSQLPFQGPVTFGKGGAFRKPDVMLQLSWVSAIQGEFGFSQGRCTYQDLGGNSLAQINQVPISPRSGVYLQPYDVVTLCGGEMRSSDDLLAFILAEAPSLWAEVPLKNPELSVLQDGLRYEGRILSSAFGMMVDKNTVREVPLTVGQGLITDTYMGIVLPDRILYCPLPHGGSRGEDVLSAYGSGQEVPGSDGSMQGEQQIPDASQNAVLRIDIRKRTDRAGFRERVLLKDIHLEIHPGEMVLILGGSGAGKTTFMNAVTGHEKADASITYGNLDLYRDSDVTSGFIKAVPQFDCLRGEDSVFNTLDDVAKLRLPDDIREDPEERGKRVRRTLHLFGLEAEMKNSVRKLSGGQRKRLSIATEYICDPTVFFLDEPDSGLDAGSAETIMENLRTIADEKKIILVISHSPDRVVQCFDKVLVLAKDAKENCGRTAFYGTIDDARRFFGTEKLEDIVKKVNKKEEGGDGMADEYIRRFAQLEAGNGPA